MPPGLVSCGVVVADDFVVFAADDAPWPTFEADVEEVLARGDGTADHLGSTLQGLMRAVAKMQTESVKHTRE